MKWLATITVTLAALSYSVGAQNQSPEWVDVSPLGESFHISMPNSPSIDNEKLGATSGKRYTALAVGASYTLWSLANANYRSSGDDDEYLDACAELVWEHLLKPARDKLDDKARRRARMTYVQGLRPEGLPGREYTLTVGDVTGTTEFLVAREHIYVMLAIGLPGGDWPRERFFASFRTSLNLPDTPAIAPSGIGPGIRGLSPNATDYNRIFSGREVNQRARVLEKPEPTYTESARKFGVEGTVIIRCVFSKNGEVTNLHVVQRLPHGLTQRAVTAGRAIRFTPALKDGQPVSMWMELQYNFHLY